MGKTSSLIAALSLCLYPACVPIDTEPDGPANETTPRPGEPPLPAPPLPTPAAPDIALWTAAGDLVIAAGDTGEIRESVAAGPAGAGGERDLTWDPWKGRLLIATVTDESGEIAARPVPGIDASSHLAWIDGRAHLLATPHGAVVFEVGYGERWRLLGDLASPSVIAPPPASAWLDTASPESVVRALDYGPNGGALHTRSAVVSGAGIGAPADNLLPFLPATLPPTARLVPAPKRGGAILIDVSGDALAIRFVHETAATSPSFIALPTIGSRVEAAVSLAGGEIVAVLLSGSAAVLAIAVEPGGAVSSSALLPLPGEVAPADRFFSRDLAALTDARLLAATSAGVYALDIGRSAGPASPGALTLTIDAAFAGAALRGPLVVLSTPP